VGVLPPAGHIVAYPFWAAGHDDINEKYVVSWDEQIHVGSMNSINLDYRGGIGVSCVVKALTRKSRAARAVKILRKRQIVFPKLFQCQLSGVTGVDHPAVCKVLDTYEDTDNVYLVTEPLAGPSLLEKVLSDPDYCERDASSAFKTVLQALACLHGEHRMVHQNLHPENFRFSRQVHKVGAGGSAYDQGLKLLDFGLSMHIKHLSSVLQGTGMDDVPPPPPLHLVGCRSSGGDAFIAPEMRGVQATTFREVVLKAAGLWELAQTPGRKLTHRELSDAHAMLEAGDIWSAGCILHLLLSGQPPPLDPPSDGALLNFPEGVHYSARELCASLLRRNPRERPSAVAALRNSWFFACDLLKNGHPSVSRLLRASMVTPATPVPDVVRASMHQHFVLCKLRKLVLQSCTLLAFERSTSVDARVLPVHPSQDASHLAKKVKAMHTNLNGVFQAMLCMHDPVPASLPVRELRRVVESADKAGFLPWVDPIETLDRIVAKRGVDGGITLGGFVEFIQHVCG
jgi:serine/threonine protein kinase